LAKERRSDTGGGSRLASEEKSSRRSSSSSRNKSRDSPSNTSAKDKEKKEQRKRRDERSSEEKPVSKQQRGETKVMKDQQQLLPPDSAIPPSDYVPGMTDGAIRPTTTGRESSGGTSKGDDSGIAEETSAESGRHDSARQRLPGGGGGRVESAVGPGRPSLTSEFVEIMQVSGAGEELPPAPVRPGTAVGRPRTAVGRPGTAVARPAPPKLKKSVLAAAAGEEQKPEAALAMGAAEVLLIPDEPDDGAKSGTDIDQFLVEEGDDEQALRLGMAAGALVNKILENTREQLAESIAEETVIDDTGFDMHEQRRIRAEIETVQRALQKAMQLVQPLARSLESAAVDFDASIKEIQEKQKASAQCRRLMEERNSVAASQSDTQILQLRALDAEIGDIRGQISATRSRILGNERRIETALFASSSPDKPH
jgi:hypothetical protein